jgi:hypothetical protein
VDEMNTQRDRLKVEIKDQKKYVKDYIDMVNRYQRRVEEEQFKLDVLERMLKELK